MPLSLGHNCVAASLTAFLWTEDLRVPEIPGERQGLFGEGSARDARSSVSHRMRTATGESTWGREEPRAGRAQPPASSRAAAQSHCFLRQYPQRRNTTTVLGIFLASDSKAGLLRPSMSHPSMS